MHFHKAYLITIITLGALLVGSVMAFWPGGDARAQCGSQASSCKNCHEVQGQDPVNNDGTGWHESHAFGDFCYICHGGNNQSMDADAAHASMVPPLSDVQAGCASCHPNDLMDRAQVYATALGVEVGTGGGGDSPNPPSSSPPSSGVTGETSGNNASASSDSGGSEMVVTSPDLVDYNQRYAETVLGGRPINWGNLIVIAMIVMLGIGGGGYVFWNERRLRLAKLPEAPSSGEAKAESANTLKIEGYPDEVVALLPKIARLNPLGLHALRRLLENPEEASQLLHSLSRLDLELVRRVRGLDQESKALLLALSGD
jgi:hypothetical protein